jgi:hypothetical protein
MRGNLVLHWIVLMEGIWFFSELACGFYFFFFFFSLFRFESEVVRISQALFGFLAIRIYYLITGTPVIWLSIFKFGQLVFF